jgi:hypothetical protein
MCLVARSGKDMGKVFDEIQAQLKHVYLLSYKPPAPGETKWRTIEVGVSGLRHYKIRGKQGYFPE